ncbi:28296_t:CDS:2, partial [Racocetra persica]
IKDRYINSEDELPENWFEPSKLQDDFNRQEVVESLLGANKRLGEKRVYEIENDKILDDTVDDTMDNIMDNKLNNQLSERMNERSSIGVTEKEKYSDKHNLIELSENEAVGESSLEDEAVSESLPKIKSLEEIFLKIKLLVEGYFKIKPVPSTKISLRY